MKIFLIAALLPLAAFAQVNVCADSTGRKTYTETACENIGMKPVSVITDIKPKSKHCYDLKAIAAEQRAQARRYRNDKDGTGITRSLAVIPEGQADRIEEQYKRECER